MRHILYFFILATNLIATIPLTASLPQNLPYQTETQLKQWVGTLASDSMLGRKNGSKELEFLSKWLSKEFKKIGLTPPPENDGYMQHFKTKTKQGKYKLTNIIGYIKGSDSLLKQEYIIISAHYDHIGWIKGAKGDSVFNGADDNASGVATLLGIAHHLKHNLNPKRSIIFIAFSGEEIGLTGSRYYVKNPLFPLSSTMVNINLDMTGSSSKLGRNKFMLSGHEYSNLKEIITHYNSHKNWELIDSLPESQKSFKFSDNYPFARVRFRRQNRIGIPAHTVFTYYGEGHLHKLWDNPEQIDYKNLENLVTYLSGLIDYLSSYKGKIDWLKRRF